jgi:FtsH-binding integral membrane protein
MLGDGGTKVPAPERELDISRCARAIGFVAMIVGVAFMALAGLAIFEASSSRGFIAFLLIIGGVGIIVGGFLFSNADKTIN